MAGSSYQPSHLDLLLCDTADDGLGLGEAVESADTLKRHCTKRVEWRVLLTEVAFLW